MTAEQQQTRMDRNPSDHVGTRVQIKVNCRVNNGQVLPGGVLAQFGESVVTVFEHDLPAIRDLVETDHEGIKFAETVYNNAINNFEKEVQERTKNKGMGPRALNGPKYTGPISVAAAYYAQFRRSIKPLLSVEEIKTLPPYETTEQSNLRALVNQLGANQVDPVALGQAIALALRETMTTAKK